jgi:Family of unknown function (DUF5947)
MGAVAALHRFVRTREPEESCDTCGAPLPPDHIHNFEAAVRRIRCACQSCAILYASVYPAVPRRVGTLTNFQLTDAQWDELMIPICLAFISYSTPAGKMIAQYPGPAGAVESLLPPDAWEQISTANPEVDRMQPDVEALLVNRVGLAREYFVAPIDECYRLAGLIRLHWRGLSGGAAVWGEIARFFDALRQRGLECPA